MTPKTQKRSRSTAVSSNHIEQATSFLQELPSKPKTDLSLRETMQQMQDSIRAALEKGYSYQDVAEILSSQGISISAITLKNYVPSGKRSTGQTKLRKVRKSQSSAATIQAVVSPEVVEQSQPVAPVVASINLEDNTEDKSEVSKAPRRTSSRVKTSDKPETSQKPRTAAKAKSSTKTQSGTKSSSTKGRQKA